MNAYNMNRNISFYDYVCVNLRSIARNFFQPVYDFKENWQTFKNYRYVIKQKRTNNYPIHAKLRNGQIISLKNIFQVRAIKWAGTNNCFFQNDAIVIKIKSLPEIKLLHWEHDIDLGVFFEDEYKSLPVKDKIVIDIGANIGDTAIYFALKGAKKIIAIEPSPINHNFAKENIELNKVDQKIELLLAGCSYKPGTTYLENDKGGSTFSLELNKKKGVEIPLLTLEGILSKISEKPTILKIDCEGCEYDIVLSSTKEILQNFTQIQIEYHYGYLNLKEKLEKCGFRVRVAPPRISKKLSNNKSRSYVGFIYAEKS